MTKPWIEARAERERFQALPWEEQAAFLREEAQRIAEGVATIYGAGWTTKRQNDKGDWSGWRMIGPDGEMVDFDMSRESRDKVRIHGTIPSSNGNAWGEGAGVSIKVAVSRGVETIAKEIERRFLPEYRVKLAERIEKNKEKAEYESKRVDVRGKLMAAFGELNTDRYKPGDERFSFTSYRSVSGSSNYPAGYGEVWASPTSVTIKFESLPVSVALEIAAVYRKYKGDK